LVFVPVQGLAWKLLHIKAEARSDIGACIWPVRIRRMMKMLRRGEAFRNRAKRLLAEKKKLSAAWLQAASPITAEIMAKAGFDILMVDMEHGPGDIMNLISQMQAISHYEAVPFVRAPWNDFVTIKRILDAGVSGILVPYVNNAKEAARAVSACKYPLEGIRGIAPSPRAGGYGMNQRDYLDYANEELDVLVAVETKTAVDHIEEIVGTNGLDGIFIGPMDLATSFGHFCNPGDREVQEAIRRVEAVVLKSDKFLATVAGSFEQARELYEKGYSMVVMMSDTTTLGKMAMEQTDRFREAYPQR